MAHIGAPSRGFTLIEVLVVMALLAVISSLAVPSFRAFAINQRLSSAGSDFLLGVLQARSEAIRQGKFVSILPNDGSSWASGWYLSLVSNTCATVGSAFGKTDALDSSITVKASGTTKSFANSSPSFTFTPAGFPKTDCASPYYSGAMNGKLVFQASETSRERAVIMSNSGRARLCDPSRETCTAD